MTLSNEVRAAREAVVREHMDSENRQDFEATMATFSHPRYELIATGEVHDGEAAVRARQYLLGFGGQMIRGVKDPELHFPLAADAGVRGLRGTRTGIPAEIPGDGE